MIHFYLSEVQNLGLVCTVDLFPVAVSDAVHKDPKDGGSRKNLSAPSHQTPYSSSIPSQYSQGSHPQSFTFVPAMPYSPTQQSTISMNTIPPSHVPRHQSISGYLPPSGPATDVVYHVGDYQVTESSKVTQALVGATFVQPANVDYQGKKSLMFVFAVCNFHKARETTVHEYFRILL